MASLTHLAALLAAQVALGQHTAPLEVLAPGTLPASRVQASDGEWVLALCGGVLRPAKLRVSPAGPDQVKVQATCDARALVRGVSPTMLRGVRPARVTTRGEAQTSPRGPLAVTLHLGKRRWRIDRVRLGSTGYRLVLAGGRADVTLYECQSTDEARWELLWAGDLDGDAQVDLLIDASDAFDLRETRLYLSRGAFEDVDEVSMLRTEVTGAPRRP